MVSCDDGMKDEDRTELHGLLSLECEPKLWLDGLDENVRFTPPINFFILHNTWHNNTQQQVPSTLGVNVSISRMVEGNKGLCREITSDDAGMKTSLLQH
jgi:hypothetical protein